MKFGGIIYGYPHYVGQVQSSEQKRLIRRHRNHLEKHPSWLEPVILERVFGKDRKDLLFNLAFQETIWIFKKHTYNRIWCDGENKVIPWSQDYMIPGKVGNRQLKSKNMFLLHKKYPEMAFRSSRMSHKLYPTLSSETMKATHRRYPNMASDLWKKHGKNMIEGAVRWQKEHPKEVTIARKRIHELHPNLARSNGHLIHRLYPDMARKNGYRFMHNRWHTERKIINPKCYLCVPTI